MKKTLALVLALAMVFSTITVAFAEDTIGADAQSCTNLGMLVGEGNGVNAAYLAQTPTRMQAAIMLLRLKGLYDEAIAFTGTENFSDGNMAWAGGKNLLAYLKAHPEVGFNGNPDGTFAPEGKMTAQAYYKVMLVALGYTENLPTVVGDFTWASVIEFAASKGLTKVAAVTNFTVNDLATATVEALKANVKDGSKTLVASLIEAGKVDKAKAIADGLYTDTTTTAAELKAVKAVANNKVEVEFTADVAKTFAENAANFKVVVKGSTTALEVKSAVLYSAKKAVLETAAQTAGTAYTVTVGAISKNFAGIAADKTAAKVDKVECVDTNTVEVTFDKMMDSESAINIANYTLNNNATVKAAAISSSRKVVTLTTEGVAHNKPYTVKVENVKNADLVVTKAVSKNFTGKTDTKAPKIDSIDSDSNNIRVIVNFDDEHGVDKASAENVANYAITVDSTTLEIKGIIANDVDEDDYYDQVEITTAAQENGGKYKLTISNLVDGSVSANKITKDLTKEFRGKKADTTAPKLDGTPYGTTDTKFYVTFDEASRLDVATATDVNNYEFNNDVVVKSAALLDTEHKDSADAHIVVLTTSAVDEGDWYKLTVKNVADEFGNVIKTVTKNVKGVKEDVQPPYVEAVKSISQTKVELYFQERLDEASAEDPTNYVFNNDLGVALKAELDTDEDESHTVVTLTTPEQVAGKTYKVTMNNIKDENGNALADVVVRVVSTLEDSDTARPEIASIDATYSNVLRVTFDEPVKATAGVAYVDVDDEDADTAADGRLYMVGRLLEDKYTVEFKATDADGAASPATVAWDFNDGEEYDIVAISGVTDEHNNTYLAPTAAADRDSFTGTDLVNPGPEVDSWEQIDAQTIRVYFNEPVLVGANYTTETHTGYVANAFTTAIDPDAAADDEGYSTVDFVRTAGIDADKKFAFNFTSVVTDYAGADAVDADDEVPSNITSVQSENGAANFDTDTYTEIESYIDDEDGPVLETVEATAKREITLTYNENLETQGSYKVTWEDDDTTKTVSINQPAAADIDDNTVVFTTNADLDPDTVYTLTIVTAAKDKAQNSTEDYKDVEISFTGTDVEVADYIRGVKIVDARNITVTTSCNIANVGGFEYTVEQMDGNTVVATVGQKDATPNSDGDDDNTENIVLTKPLVDGWEYRVVVTGVQYAYRFDGIAEDGGIDIGATTITFSGWDVQDYVVRVVYNGAEYYVLPIDTNADGTEDAFGVDMYQNGTPAITFDLNTGLVTGNVFTVEVIKTNVDVLPASYAGAAAYEAAVEAAGVMDTVHFSAEFEHN